MYRSVTDDFQRHASRCLEPGVHAHTTCLSLDTIRPSGLVKSSPAFVTTVSVWLTNRQTITFSREYA